VWRHAVPGPCARLSTWRVAGAEYRRGEPNRVHRPSTLHHNRTGRISNCTLCIVIGLSTSSYCKVVSAKQVFQWSSVWIVNYLNRCYRCGVHVWCIYHIFPNNKEADMYYFASFSLHMFLMHVFFFNSWSFETIWCHEKGTSSVQVVLIGLTCKDWQRLSLHPETIRVSRRQQLQLPLN